MGVACPSGAEKIIHGLRHCMEHHCMHDEDFAVMKIDMRNAFNLVSRGSNQLVQHKAEEHGA